MSKTSLLERFVHGYEYLESEMERVEEIKAKLRMKAKYKRGAAKK